MEEYGEYLDDEEGGYFEDEDGEMGATDWERYRADMFHKQKALDALMNAKRSSVEDLADRCVFPMILGEPCIRLAELIGFCLIVNFTSCLPFLPKIAVPMTSLLLGLLVVVRWFESQSICLIGTCILGYFCLCLVVYVSHRFGYKLGGLSTAVFGFGCMLLLQLFFLNAKDMTRLRGALMIIVMKIISLGADLDSGSICRLPNVLDYFSYVFSVSTVTFGPWISFKQHNILMERKSLQKIILPFVKGVLAAFASLICLCYSGCILDWLILDAYEYYSKWIIAYRDAQSFRFSHYFVCLISEATVHLSGYNLPPENEEGGEKSTKTREFYVTKLLKVELPRSLVDVVVNWNIPMHNWLKIYAFRPMVTFGKLLAVLSTYAASSLLHGFNFQLSAVLLSLGIYSYAEHKMREKLSKSFNACVRARSCSPDCQHRYTFYHPLVLLTNFCFLFLSLFHLTYLGMVFDGGVEQEMGYSKDHTVEKWSEFGFISHYVALGSLIFALII